MRGRALKGGIDTRKAGHITKLILTDSYLFYPFMSFRRMTGILNFIICILFLTTYDIRSRNGFRPVPRISKLWNENVPSNTPRGVYR